MDALGGIGRGPVKSFLLRLAVPLLLIVLWQVLADLFGSPRVPRPSAIVTSARALIENGDLVLGLATSLGRVFFGFLLASAIAVPLGIVMGSVRPVERNLDPLVESFRPIAAIAILPLVILWLGTGSMAAVAIVAYAAFFPILINTIAGVKRIDPNLMRAARTMGVPSATRMWAVMLPAALPAILVGMRIGLGIAWTAIIAAELAVGAKAGGEGGIGQMMFVFYAYSVELNGIVVCMISVGIVALLLDRVLRTALRVAVPWSHA
jgi:ABC-type nitrate/sulfonate/bicarbonate transport system permease component